MRKSAIAALVFLLSFAQYFSQTNHDIKDNNGNLLPSELYYCTGETFNLKIDAAASSTGDYLPSGVSPVSFPLKAGAIPILFDPKESNKFSQAFPIGFDFNFYGNSYSQIVLGSNGRLVFTNNTELLNLKYVNTYIDRTFSGVSSNIPYAALPSSNYNKVYRDDNTELQLAQIFFGYADLVPKSQNSSVQYFYSHITFDGQKALLVSFQYQVATDGLGGILPGNAYNSFILLMEDGRIIIFVDNKTGATYNAILGIQNETGDKARVAGADINSKYNNGKWKSDGKAWLFTPNQNLTPKIEWLVDGVSTGNTTDIFDYTPQKTTEKVSVKISFFDDNGNQVGDTKTSEVIFNKLEKPIISSPIYGQCAMPAQLKVENPISALQYQWFDSLNKLVGNGPEISVGNGDYFVEVAGANNGCKVKSDVVSVNINSPLPPFIFENKTISECDFDSNKEKTFDLTSLIQYPLSPDYTLTFFDVNNNIIPKDITLQSGETKSLKVNIKTAPGITPSCDRTFNFKVSYLSLHSTTNLQYSPEICFGTNKFTIQDFKQWAKKEKSLNVDYDGFDIAFSLNGVKYDLTEVDLTQHKKIFVKIKHPDFSCELSGRINFNIKDKVTAQKPTTQLPPQCADSTSTFDLASLIPEINPSPSVTVTFHESLADAQSGSRPVNPKYRSGLGKKTLYIRVTDSLGCVAEDFPTIELLVYYKPTLINKTLQLTNCSGNSIFDLTQRIEDLVQASPDVNIKAEYFSERGALLDADQIAKYDASILGDKPYILLIYNPTCNARIDFDLRYSPLPEAQVKTIPVCNIGEFSLQDFKNRVISNPANYKFYDKNNKQITSDITIASLPLTYEFYIEDITSGCRSTLQSVTFKQNDPTPVLISSSDVELCDETGDRFDGMTTFNLDNYRNRFTNDPSDKVEYFEDAARTLPISGNYTNSTPLQQTVYLRITAAGLCPVGAELNLKVKTPTKSTTLKDEYDICYGETIEIDAGTENATFQWSDGQTGQKANFTKAGTYTVTLTNADGCSYTHQFVISDKNQPVIAQVIQTNDRIEIIATSGLAPYEYSFDGGKSWQAQNFITNPTLKTYTLQVRSATGCLGAPKMVYFISVTNVITPNGDGKNDTWTVENLDKMDNGQIQIFDRYGKVVFDSVAQGSLTWNGTVNGRVLPTASYWYIVKWYDPTTLKNEIRQGWILLKNRN